MKLNTLQGSVQMIAAHQRKLEAAEGWKAGDKLPEVELLTRFVAAQFGKKEAEVKLLTDRQMVAQAFGF